MVAAIGHETSPTKRANQGFVLRNGDGRSAIPKMRGSGLHGSNLGNICKMCGELQGCLKLQNDGFRFSYKL